jgi:2-oxoglutarate ferredoxin oxidoreductase subunit delta
MAARGMIQIRIDHCKGCQLCMPACKFDCIALSAETQTNRFGYRYGVFAADRCTACALCGMMCPDHAIDVYRM